MLKTLLTVLAGAAAVLQIQRWWQRRREQMAPNAVTGRLLDRVNDRLESRRRTSEAGSPVPKL
jgi:hypothetical protein